MPTHSLVSLPSGDRQVCKRGDPAHRGGRGGDELREADGGSVGEGPLQVPDDLGEAVLNGGALHRPPLQADLRAQRGRLQEDALLQRDLLLGGRG